MTGENIALPEQAMPFILNQAVDTLQPDLVNAGGITGTKIIADIAALYRVPVCLHNVKGYLLNMASQQFSAAVFNCPLMECRGDAHIAKEASENKPIIEDGCMKVSELPGLGAFLDHDFLKATRIEGEPWWGEEG
jgi:L-alanine-DL-glutamate epimerase-like enolase superfamily enzyme